MEELSGPPSPPSSQPSPSLDALALLAILRLTAPDDSVLLAARSCSKDLRDLADSVLEDRFKARWGITQVVEPPPAAPAFVAVRAAAFVACHAVQGKDSLAALAVRHNTDVPTLKRLNNLLSDHALFSRSHLYVPVQDAAAATAGRRVGWVCDEHSRRRLVVILADGQELPATASGSGGGRQPRRGSGQPFVVAKLAEVLQRALKLDAETATYYVQQADCDVRAAIERYEEDKRWEKMMRRRGPRLRA